MSDELKIPREAMEDAAEKAMESMQLAADLATDIAPANDMLPRVLELVWRTAYVASVFRYYLAERKNKDIEVVEK